MLEKLNFSTLNVLSKEANNRLALINTKEALENNIDTSSLLNIALEDVIFAFTKVAIQVAAVAVAGFSAF